MSNLMLTSLAMASLVGDEQGFQRFGKLIVLGSLTKVHVRVCGMTDFEISHFFFHPRPC